jgi:non-homologous end joining protein Ku
MSARSIWKGQLTLGYVTFLVNTYKAIDPPNAGLEGKLLHNTCLTPISQPRRCTKCDVELATADFFM